MTTLKLVYVMDPMCAWCYGFQPELEEFLDALPGAEVSWIMGGLAPDTSTPMSRELKQTISSYWYQIEAVAHVKFNHDYWHLNTPYRSTYSACRAVIAAETMCLGSAQMMVKAIQTAYYKEAKNPSLEETLIHCACSIDLDENQFLQVFKSEETNNTLQQHLGIAGQLRVHGFPALFFIEDNVHARPLTLGYCKTTDLAHRLDQLKK